MNQSCKKQTEQTLSGLFKVRRYTEADQMEWNRFVANSKNGTFLFNRAYMDYHADRFTDCSLLVYRKGKLHALLPGNVCDRVFYSHQGLTYGGLIMSDKVTATELDEVFVLLNDYLRSLAITRVVYKAMPFIYHLRPSQEDLYVLFRQCRARLTGRNLSSTICQNERIRFTESRKSGLRKAKAQGVSVRESGDLASFWSILDANLKQKYGVAPVHTLDEIKLLQSRFPEQIKLYMAYLGNEPLGGTLLYITKQVVHTQYISASPLGKELGALDLVFDYLINMLYIGYLYFDFGQSTERMGEVLNTSLLFQKEGFGGRGVCYDIYEYDL